MEITSRPLAGRNGLVQNCPEEPVLLLVSHESGDAGRVPPLLTFQSPDVSPREGNGCAHWFVS